MMRTISRILFGFALAGSLLAPRASWAQSKVQTTVKFVPRKETNEKVAPEPNRLNDIVRMQVEADSDAGIARVVFEIDDQFRAEVKQPPYTYDWDTLAENDGQHTVSVVAYNINGQAGTKRVKVKVENQLSLGHKHWSKEALNAFRRADELALIRAARKAYRITSVDTDAARMMALAVGVQGDVGRAFQMLDDRQLGIPPNEPITLEARGFLQLVRAYQNRDVRAMLPDLQQGLSATRRRALNALDEVLDEFPSKTQDVDGLIARGDAYLQVGKRAEALTNYEKALEFASAGEQRRRVGQRVTLGLLYNGRLAEAEQTALKLIRKQEANATTFALLGAVQFQQRKYQQARDAVEAGVKARNPASLTVATFCDLVLGAKAQAYKEAKDAVLAADMAETQFVAQALLADVGDKEGAYKSFYRAALNAPLYMPVLVERAYEIMAYEAQDGERFSKALNLFDLVLALEPDNADATAGRAIALMQEKRHTAAQAAITRLGKLEPTAPDYFVLAAADLARDAAKIRMVNDSLARARQIDPLNFKDAKVPDLPELTARIMRLRRTIPMTPRFLDRADQPPAPLDDAKIAQAAP